MGGCRCTVVAAWHRGGCRCTVVAAAWRRGGCCVGGSRQKVPVAARWRLPRHAGGRLRLPPVGGSGCSAAGGCRCTVVGGCRCSAAGGGRCTVVGGCRRWRPRRRAGRRWAGCRGRHLVVGQPPRGLGACVSADAPPGARPPGGRARRALTAANPHPPSLTGERPPGTPHSRSAEPQLIRSNSLTSTSGSSSNRAWPSVVTSVRPVARAVAAMIRSWAPRACPVRWRWVSSSAWCSTTLVV